MPSRSLVSVFICLLLLVACTGRQKMQALPQGEGGLGQSDGGRTRALGEVTQFSPRPLPFEKEYLQHLKVPKGFKVTVFEKSLEYTRMLEVAPDGTVFVTQPKLGMVSSLKDTVGDGVSDSRKIVVSGLPDVHGVRLHGDYLYLATPTEIYRAPYINGEVGPLQKLVDNLPTGGRHPYRTLGFDAQNRLYVSIGSSCNACQEKDERYATILRGDAEGQNLQVFARGLRNTIGFDWHPQTGQLWGMDIGSDWVGADEPPEELNRLIAGKNYGWPWCYGARQVDPNVKDPPPGDKTPQAFCKTTEPAVLTTQAHSSPIGMAFYTGTQFPKEYWGDAFIALRGSWNRKPAVGYKIARIDFENGKPVAIRDFMTGFLLEDGNAQFGRLAGVAVMPDGSLLVSDDENGMIYRISYQAE